MSTQLSLGIALRDNATFANYYTGDNAALLHSLQACVQGVGEQFLYVYGPSGVGRSHLLQACCHATTELSALYLPLKTHAELSPEMLEGLEQLHLICLDDVDAIVGMPEWEEALFHFYNRAREQGTRLIVSAECPPQPLKIHLADLHSRLACGLALHIHELSDVQKVAALQLRAHQRGLELSDEVGYFLLNHCPRDMSTLFEVLERLDKASLEAKRKLSIPFIKTVLL